MSTFTLVKNSVFIVLVGTVLLLMGYVILEHSSIQLLPQVFAKYFWCFTLWRYALYALVLILWPYFIRLMAKRQKWPLEVIVYLSNQRLKLLAFFTLIEMFFVYNLIGHLMIWL